jgi:hypothetical protein
MTKIFRTFTRQELADLLHHHAVHTEITDEDDHCTYKATIIKVEQRHYEVVWADHIVGEPTFHGSGPEVTVTEVEQRPVTVVQWLPVEGPTQ